MSASDYKKYWFIKLPREFFNRHDIKILESQPNGKDYCLFYLKLLLESVTHDGELRFSETIPYDENMLSVVTNTNIDVVRSAMKVLHQLGLVEMWDDQTIYMTEVKKMLEVQTGGAIRKKEYRERQKGDNVPQLSQNCPQDIDKDKELDIDKDKELDLLKENNKENDDLDLGEPKIALDTVRNYIYKNHLNNLKPVYYWSKINCENIEDWQEFLNKENERLIKEQQR